MTTISALNGKDDDYENNWDGVSSVTATKTKAKLECYFEIFLPSKEVDKCENSRDIWMYSEKNLVLNNYNWTCKTWDGVVIATENYEIRSKGPVNKHYVSSLGIFKLSKTIILCNPENKSYHPVYKKMGNGPDRHIYMDFVTGNWVVHSTVGFSRAFLTQESSSSRSPKAGVVWQFYDLDTNTWEEDLTMSVKPVYLK